MPYKTDGNVFKWEKSKYGESSLFLLRADVTPQD